MGKSLAAVLVLCLASACGSGDDGITPDSGPPAGPFDQLNLTEDIHADGLDGPVHVARDQYGVAHIYAGSTGDLAYAEGYVMAHDRLPQMDILRRFGSGRLGEIFGGLDSSVVDTDLEMRVHRMVPLATQSWMDLQASADPKDQDLVKILQRFADGVNAYATDLQGGKWTLDPAVLASFDPTRFDAWSPIDSLVLGRFQAFALSWTTPVELDITEVWQSLRALFDVPGEQDPEKLARAGVERDILRIAPVGKRPTIDGFPNVITDTGSRSDGDAASNLRDDPTPTHRFSGATKKQPKVPRELFDAARKTFAEKILSGIWDPHRFMAPRAGSNDFAVADEVAGGKTLLEGDQHLQMPNPSIFYPVHLIVDGQIDAEGVTFPGIPGIILGENGKLAWSSTVVYHDVNDVYLEDIEPCTSGTGNCAQHTDGSESPVTTWNETVKIGVLGTPTGQVTATYETVEGHGPIIPTISNGQVVPRSGSAALSVQYTGYDETFEIRATYGLLKAETVQDGFTALHDFSYGGQNWMLADNQGNIGWTTHAKVPLRTASEYTWNPVTNPDGLAPFFVLPGDGTVGWEGWMSSRYIPHAINPAQNYLATANADPVGANFDDDPFNSPIVDGRPLWVGSVYGAGLREERITNLIEQKIQSGQPVDLAWIDRIQSDSSSNVGRHLTPTILGALAALDDPTGQPADAVAFVAGLSGPEKTAMLSARDKLAAWSFETPPAANGTPSAAEITDSVATTLFNNWMHFFIQDAVGDEMNAISFPVFNLDDHLIVRTIYSLLVEPQTEVQDAVTGQPVLCDRYGTAGDDSCTGMILRAFQDAIDHLTSVDGFGTTDQTLWRWGDLHRLTIKPLFPNTDLDIPQDDEPGNAGGFPRAGDNMAVNRADCGWGPLDFANAADGPAQRFLAEIPVGGQVKLHWALPGGTIYDRGSPHYRDQLDNYYLPNQHFDAPYTTDEIVAAGEDRWIFR